MAPEIGISNTIPFQMNVRATSGGGPSGLQSIANNFSMQFNGIDEYFDVDNLTTLNGTQDATVCCWFKKGASSSTTPGQIISTVGTSIRDHGIALRLRPSDGRLDYSFGFPPPPGSSGYTSATITNVTDTNWHHVAIVIDRAALTTTSYFDGAKVATSNPNNYSMSGLYRGFRIGARAQDGAKGFIGYVDEVGVFDYKLTDTDIEAIYDATNNDPTQSADLSTLSTPPIAWYRMGD